MLGVVTGTKPPVELVEESKTEGDIEDMEPCEPATVTGVLCIEAKLLEPATGMFGFRISLLLLINIKIISN